MSQITTIIQGPLHQNSINTIEHYLKFGKVVISCYDTDDIKQIPDHLEVRIIQTVLPEVVKTNNGKVFLQAWSTFHGLKICDTNLFIKVRSDESWGNIQPFVSKVIANPEQYTSCNIYFKGTEEPLHPSDHMFGGLRQYFITGLHRLLISYLEKGYVSGYDFGLPWLPAFAVAEVPIFLSFLYGKGIIYRVTDENKNQITFDNTELVNIDEMQPYIWACTTIEGKKYWTDSQDLYHTYPSLKNKDEFWSLKYDSR